MSSTLPITDLRYPAGRHTSPDSLTAEERTRCVAEIAALPEKLRAAVRGLTDAQLDTPYRPGGWTVRQVVHHIPDSHLNAYIRFKLALTEDGPTIKPYDEARWAELPEARMLSVDVSLALLEALHARWVAALRAVQETQWSRRFYHAENERWYTLDQLVALYAWHSRHHLAHITTLRDRERW